MAVVNGSERKDGHEARTFMALASAAKCSKRGRRWRRDYWIDHISAANDLGIRQDLELLVPTDLQWTRGAQCLPSTTGLPGARNHTD